MDIVYVLGSGSPWSNNEIRYSLRSVQKNCTCVDNIYIVGERPTFLKDVIHLPFPDQYQANVQRNIMSKIAHACTHEAISDDFLFVNDDHLFLSPLNIASMPYYWYVNLHKHWEKTKAGNPYAITIQETYKLLKKRELPLKNFDCHYPIIYNKKLFAAIMASVDWVTRWGYLIKSLYCNSMEIPGVEFPDCKLNDNLPYDQIQAFFELKDFASWHDRALHKPLKQYIAEHFPEPSRWEIF